jgi:putative ABC transport system permease protein
VAIRDSDWTVVGVFESNGDARESELIGDAESILSVYQSSIVNSVTVQLQSPASFSDFKDALTTDPTLTVSVQREEEYYARQSRRLGVMLTIVAYIVGGIMAIGAIFGGLATMYAAVSTRTVEIATLRAIGYGPAGVVVSVVLESLLLASLGALGGSALAWLALSGRTISTLIGSGQIVAQLQVNARLFAMAIAWAGGIGLVGGLFPAIRAARQPVATALRAM